jgi:hypothetical protein
MPRTQRPPADLQVYIINGEPCRKIPLSNGLWAIVDESEYDRLANVRWFYIHGYAYRCLPKGTPHTGSKIGEYPIISMQSFIRGQPKLDHENLDKLDNRRRNLRACVHYQNLHNLPRRKIRSSQYRGVSRSSRNRWKATATVNGVMTYLGLYDSETEAAKVRDSYLRQFPELDGFFHPNFTPTGIPIE